MDKKKEKNIDLIAYLLITVFILFFLFLSVGRHYALKSYLNDLGTYDQVVWNTLHGNFFKMTCSMINGVYDYLGGHFSLILLMFVPLYAIKASPVWFLAFQSLAVGLGAIPIYWMAREKLKNYWVALIFLFSYLLNPFLHNALLYDFHEVVLAVVFASWGFYFLEKKNDKAFIICSFLLALSQEHMALLVFMMGLYAYFIQKRKKFGLWVSGISISYVLLIMLFVIPHFSSLGKQSHLYEDPQYGNRYYWLGSTVPEIIKNIAYYPDGVARVLLSKDRLLYLFYLILPVFSLVLYAWPIVVTFPILLISLLSSNPMTYSLYFYHSAIIIPFVYFSAILTFRQWFLTEKFLRRLFLIAIVCSSFYSLYFFSLVGISGKGIFSEYRPGAHARKISEIKKIIPASASLSVQHNLGPHFSEREEIYRFPVNKDEAEYVLLDRTNPYGKKLSHFSDFGYSIQMDVPEWQKDIDELMQSSIHDLIYKDDGYLIFRKK
jgi:uncharacterized membrane protein